MESFLDLSDERTLAALDANYLACSGGLMGSSAFGAYAEQQNLALVSCGAPMARHNTAHLRPPLVATAAAIERAEQFFAQPRLPYSVEFRDRPGPEQTEAESLLRSAGFVRTEAPVPGMALAPIRFAPPPPDPLRIERVETDAQREAFVRTAAVGFGFEAAAGALIFTRGFLDRPEVQAFIGSVGDEVVATSMLFQSGAVAGIYWVATLPDWRARGFGAAITWASVDAGARAGCRVASLQASTMGRPVYARMGFAHALDYVRYMKPDTI